MPKNLPQNSCDESVFSKLYEKYAQPLNNYLYYKYGSRLNPSDKAQEAFIKLWENCKKVPFEKAKSFLFTTANNMMLNAVKHDKVVLNYQNNTFNKDYNNQSPEFLLLEEEFLKQYQKALSNLKEEQRVAFLLNKAEGKKHAEIAELLGVTKKVVEYRIYTAFKQLKDELQNFNLK